MESTNQKNVELVNCFRNPYVQSRNLHIFCSSMELRIRMKRLKNTSCAFVLHMCRDNSLGLNAEENLNFCLINRVLSRNERRAFILFLGINRSSNPHILSSYPYCPNS